MPDTISIILIIVWLVFMVIIHIGGIIADQRERKERWALFEDLFSAAFRDKEAESIDTDAVYVKTPPSTREYEPVCPRGYNDCVWDPAYIKYHHPNWYKDLYGDMTPEEAVNAPTGCKDKVKEDPDEKYYCYDDEEK